ncbi:MAG: nucleotidyltransferase domain-containing protein [Candidatus Latescibacteria bacterium]|nr:nucleotidyltransferase domain-containing protein [Candidatus Latescibacterota bacterium]
MAKIPAHIASVLKGYVSDLEKNFAIRRVVLFGSYARGDHRADSDIDLAIFSDSFRDKKFVDIVSFLLSKSRRYKVDLEPLGFSYEEYLDSAGNDCMQQIKNEGIAIYSDGHFVL